MSSQLVWIFDGEAAYTKIMLVWMLNPDGTTHVDGRLVTWQPVVI